MSDAIDRKRDKAKLWILSLEKLNLPLCEQEKSRLYLHDHDPKSIKAGPKVGASKLLLTETKTHGYGIKNYI
jgi:hypothetical protein